MQICFIRVLNVMPIMTVLHKQNSLNFSEHIFLLLTQPMKQKSSWALLPCELNVHGVCPFHIHITHMARVLSLAALVHVFWLIYELFSSVIFKPGTWGFLALHFGSTYLTPSTEVMELLLMRWWTGSVIRLNLHFQNVKCWGPSGAGLRKIPSPNKHFILLSDWETFKKDSGKWF